MVDDTARDRGRRAETAADDRMISCAGARMLWKAITMPVLVLRGRDEIMPGLGVAATI